jgi:hypothetical protein
MARGERYRLAIGLLALTLGIAASVRAAMRLGVDFSFLHLTGKGLLAGVNVYDRAWQDSQFSELYGLKPQLGMFYPPATGFVLVPLSILPYSVAQPLWLCILLGCVVLGVRLLVRSSLPEAAPYVWMLAAGGALLSAGARWAITPLQGAPLAFGLLCWLVVALQREQWKLAVALVAVAAAFKITLALPFFGLLLLYRRYAGVLAAGAICVGLNALGFAIMGAGSFAGYLHNIAGVESFGDINSPDPSEVYSIPRVDWIYLFYGLTRSSQFSRIACLLVAVLALLWLARDAVRLKAPFTLSELGLVLSALVCVGSAAVYHHHYDLLPFVVPFTLLAIGARPW